MQRRWHLTLDDGTTRTARFVITSLGPLSTPTLPSYDGMDDFTGDAFHTFHWPKEPVPLAGYAGSGSSAPAPPASRSSPRSPTRSAS